jgi:hypothetical protein
MRMSLKVHVGHGFPFQVAVKVAPPVNAALEAAATSRAISLKNFAATAPATKPDVTHSVRLTKSRRAA